MCVNVVVERLVHDRTSTDSGDIEIRSISTQKKYSGADEDRENSHEEDQEKEILDFTQSEYATQIDTMCRTTADDTNSQKTSSMPSRIEQMAPKVREFLFSSKTIAMTLTILYRQEKNFVHC
jgi:hypothetical protein